MSNDAGPTADFFYEAGISRQRTTRTGWALARDGEQGVGWRINSFRTRPDCDDVGVNGRAAPIPRCCSDRSRCCCTIFRRLAVGDINHLTRN
jgi:hypothetical protein